MPSDAIVAQEFGLVLKNDGEISRFIKTEDVLPILTRDAIEIIEGKVVVSLDEERVAIMDVPGFIKLMEKHAQIVDLRHAMGADKAEPEDQP